MIGAKAVDTDGKEIGRNKLISAKGKLSLQILPEKTEVKEREIVYVDVNIAGENGCVESNADEEVTVKVEGGTLLGFGSADPRTEERFDTGKHHTYRGHAQAVLRADGEGEITVSAVGSRLAGSEAKILCSRK